MNFDKRFNNSMADINNWTQRSMCASLPGSISTLAEHQTTVTI